MVNIINNNRLNKLNKISQDIAGKGSLTNVLYCCLFTINYIGGFFAASSKSDYIEIKSKVAGNPLRLSMCNNPFIQEKKISSCSAIPATGDLNLKKDNQPKNKVSCKNCTFTSKISKDRALV